MFSRQTPKRLWLNLERLTLRQLRNHSLRTQLTVGALVVSLVPLSVVGAISNFATHEALVHAANEALAGAAAQTAASLDGFIQANLDAVRTEAQLPLLGKFLALSPQQRTADTELASESAEIAATLRALSRRDQLYILSYALLDANGIGVLDTNNSKVGVDHSQHAHFQSPLATGLPYVSPVAFSEDGDPPALYFSAPVRDPHGKSVGVLVVRYNASVLQPIVVNMGGLAGKGSFAVLMDENHLRLASGSNPDLIFKTVEPLDPAQVTKLQAAHRLPRRPVDHLATHLPAFEDALTKAGTQPFFRTAVDTSAETPEAVAVARLTTEPWLIAFAQHEAVFLAPVEQQTRSAFIIAAITTLLVVLMVYGGAGVLTEPILRLTQVAEKVGAGDLDARAQVQAHDEIGTLATAFNTMTRQLRQTLDGLSERSAELRLANDRLQVELLERQRTADALRESQDRYRTLAEAAPDAIFIVNRDGVLLYANGSAAEQVGCPPEDIVGKNVRGLFPAAASAGFLQHIHQVLETKCPIQSEAKVTINGRDLWLDTKLVPLPNGAGEPNTVLGLARDITQRKQTELDRLKFGLGIERSGEAIFLTEPDGTILYVNPAFEKIYGYAKEEALGQTPRILKSGVLPPEAYATFWKTILAKQIVAGELINKTKDGRLLNIEGTSNPILDENGEIIGFLAIQRDITERKLAEERLRESEARFRSFVEHTSEWILMTDEQGTLVEWNPGAEAITGLTREAVVGKPLWDVQYQLVSPEHKSLATYARLKATLSKALRAGTSPMLNRVVEAQFQRGDGTRRIAEQSLFPIRTAKGIRLSGISRDITERKQAEAEIKRRLAELEAVNRLSTAMRAAQTLDEMLPVVLDATLAVMQVKVGSIWLYDPAKDELHLAVNRGWCAESATSRPPPERPGEGIAGCVFATRQPYISREYHLDLRMPEAARRQIPPGIGGAAIPIRAGDHVIGTFDISVTLPRELTADEIHLLTILSEIAGNAIQRTQLHEQTERRLRQLAALSEIDRAITSSFDLRVNLETLLKHVVAQLGVDAANVLVYNASSQMLTPIAGRGFRSKTVEGLELRLGEGYAGRAALERRILYIPDLRVEESSDSVRAWGDEDFVCYYGVPLIAQGEVEGVLQVFQRAPLEPDKEWLDFLNTLAGQCAIAIDNAMLFDHMQRSNVELALAYDATIEGWSRALDLRDKETEGHTQRVTDMAVKLARALGLSEEELIQVRWGALLHDIGKMGIPDSILLKPGPLTDDEWTVMKQHPVFAYQMLSPIRYLRAAIDIPYCHHEKWDSTGYPRGLQGEQIPLVARLFAVVDVWDALRSDRPYRAAWSEEQVEAYLCAQSGTHFDPAVVAAFLKLLGDQTHRTKGA